MGKSETSVNGLIAAQNKDGLSLVDNGKAAGKIVVHKAFVSGQEPTQDQVKDRGTTVNILATPSVIVQPTAPPLIIAESILVNNMASMSVKEPIRPLPLPIPSIQNKPTFIDYVHGGCEISLIVAIDFTGSNGDPRVPGTLHYRGNGLKTDYEKAILAVGNILSNFDSDKKFPVW